MIIRAYLVANGGCDNRVASAAGASPWAGPGYPYRGARELRQSTPRLRVAHGLHGGVDGIPQVRGPAVVTRINLAGRRVVIHVLGAFVVDAVGVCVIQDIHAH